MRGGNALASRRPGPFADVDVRTHAHGRRGSGAKLNTVRKGVLNWHTDSNGPACLPWSRRQCPIWRFLGLGRISNWPGAQQLLRFV